MNDNNRFLAPQTPAETTQPEKAGRTFMQKLGDVVLNVGTWFAAFTAPEYCDLSSDPNIQAAGHYVGWLALGGAVAHTITIASRQR